MPSVSVLVVFKVMPREFSFNPEIAAAKFLAYVPETLFFSTINAVATGNDTRIAISEDEMTQMERENDEIIVEIVARRLRLINSRYRLCWQRVAAMAGRIRQERKTHGSLAQIVGPVRQLVSDLAAN